MDMKSVLKERTWIPFPIFLLVSIWFLKVFAILLLISLSASAFETFTEYILVVWSLDSSVVYAGSSVGSGGSGGGINALF